MYLDGLTTIGQVCAAVNSAAADKLGARYTELYPNSAESFLRIAGDHLSARDRTQGEAGPFSITALNQSLIGMAGIGLGLYASTDQPNRSGDFEIAGAALHNDSLAKRLFLVSQPGHRPQLGGTITVTADDIDASARLGLAIGFDFSAVVDQQMSLNLDLPSLGLSALQSLADVRGAGQFQLAAHANLHLDVGIDLANPDNPRPFLYAESTQAAVDAKVWGRNLHFTAAVGPLGVSIGDGSSDNGWLVLDSDGSAKTTYNASDKSAFSVRLTDTRGIDGRVYFDEFCTDDLQTTGPSGTVHIHLPMYKADQTTSIGDMAAARDQHTSFITALQRITVPGPAPDPGGEREAADVGQAFPPDGVSLERLTYDGDSHQPDAPARVVETRWNRTPRIENGARAQLNDHESSLCSLVWRLARFATSEELDHACVRDRGAGPIAQGCH